jgi:hypothetical protein
MADTCSLRSSNSSLDLEVEDRRYLEALGDEDHIAIKSTRHPLGLFSVVAFILQQVIGECPSLGFNKPKNKTNVNYNRHRDISNTMDCDAGYTKYWNDSSVLAPRRPNCIVWYCVIHRVWAHNTPASD